VAGLADRLGLDVNAAAQGIISVVTANMARAIRLISVQRGHDPREYTLVAFGGAGPLHSARLARELEIPRVLVPRHSGILCALGLLTTDLKTNFAQTRLMPVSSETLDAMEGIFAELDGRAASWFASERIADGDRRMQRTIDMRYQGQNYELSVPLPDGASGDTLLAALQRGFEQAHNQMYGYLTPEEPIQAVTFRVEATGLVRQAEIRAQPPAGEAADRAIVATRDIWLEEAGDFVSCPVYDREQLGNGHRIAGPAIIEQMDATTLILPGQRATVDPYLNLLVED
jgi:N-methylhydantoinase A